MKQRTLKEHIEEAKRRWELNREDIKQACGFGIVIPFEDESLVYAIQDWESMMGEFTEEEYQYLKEVWDFNRWEVDFLCEHELDTGLTRENKGGANE